jgi:hypothetical protein
VSTRITILKNSFFENIFFSNYFYGICAVALSIEAALQQRFPLNNVLYFGLIFFTTVLYYTFPYIRKSGLSTNPRTDWYTKNYELMRWQQVTITGILIISGALFAINYSDQLLSITAIQWLLILIFPATGVLYYGIGSLSGNYNIRQIGWLKPFIIGFTWAGLVTIYPVLFFNIMQMRDYEFTSVGTLLFLKNFMFITVLCIMFDIKDYASDCFFSLKTFVVSYGLKKTIFQILLPLSVIGLITFIGYAVTHHFHVMRIVFNVLPFILLFIVGYSLRKRRTLLYYLTIVDGLMLAKAICGTIAIKYF